MQEAAILTERSTRDGVCTHLMIILVSKRMYKCQYVCVGIMRQCLYNEVVITMENEVRECSDPQLTRAKGAGSCMAASTAAECGRGGGSGT